MFWFSLQLFSQTFLKPRIIPQHIHKNLHISLCPHVIFTKPEFSWQILVKVNPEEAELFCADTHTWQAKSLIATLQTWLKAVEPETIYRSNTRDKVVYNRLSTGEQCYSWPVTGPGRVFSAKMLTAFAILFCQGASLLTNKIRTSHEMPTWLFIFDFASRADKCIRSLTWIEAPSHIIRISTRAMFRASSSPQCGRPSKLSSRCSSISFKLNWNAK